jgi:hypothetical protein
MQRPAQGLNGDQISLTREKECREHTHACGIQSQGGNAMPVERQSNRPLARDGEALDNIDCTR